MAIGHDADSKSGLNFGNISTINWNHTIGSAFNPILFVTVALDNSFASSSCIVTSVILDSSGQNVAFTAVTANLADSGIGDNLLWFGYVKGVSVLTVGSHNIQVNLAQSTGGDGTHAMFGGIAASFTGVDQTTPIEAGPQTAQTDNSGSTISVSVTTVTANAWIVDGLDYFGGTATANSPQTAIDGTGTTQNSSNPGLSYNGPIATPAATADGWGNGSNMYASMSAVALKPASAVVPVADEIIVY